MGFVIGIDVGGSTTKIVGIGEMDVQNPLLGRAADPGAPLPAPAARRAVP